jgi:serine/threonine-protein kinase
MLRRVELLRLTSACGVLATMCVLFHGFASPYAPGICLVLSTRLMVSTEPLRRELLITGVIALIHPAVLFVCCAFLPPLRTQLHDSRAMSTFAINTAFIQGTGLIVVIASHILWSLRRQLHEAKSVGRYKLKHRIGGGGMGEVWVAHHAALKRDIAIKILKPEVRDRSAAAVVRFEREVRATTELAHPNTVRILDYGTTPDGLWYYAMELLHGETLAALVEREGPLPAARAAHLAYQAARALGEAHARGIVHRDVKPENLFVTELGGEKDFVKVLDFGIAKVVSQEAGVTTHDGSILGTPTYISPEVAAGRAASARSDVYGLGAVLYFLLCGRPPFEEASVGALLSAHIREQPRRPSEKLGREVSPLLEELVLKCLAKDPAERPAAGSDLAASLAELDRGETTRRSQALGACPSSAVTS